MKRIPVSTDKLVAVVYLEVNDRRDSDALDRVLSLLDEVKEKWTWQSVRAKRVTIKAGPIALAQWTPDEGALTRLGRGADLIRERYARGR